MKMLAARRFRVLGSGVLAVVATTAAAAPAASAACPNDAVRTAADHALPDCRAYEQVSPEDKNGHDVGLGRNDQDTLVAAADGASVAYESLGAFPDAQSSTTVNTNFARRGAAGWASRPISPPRAPQANASFATFDFYTPDLGHAVVDAPTGFSLAPGDTVGAFNAYLRDNATGTYRTLSVNPPSGQIPSGAYTFAGASDDLRHVIFESGDALTPDAPPTSQAFFNLYEWFDGALRLVTILPDGTPAPMGGTAVSGGVPVVHPISRDGSRIVFTTPIGTPGDDAQIYVRVDGRTTLEASASQRTTPDANTAAPTFMGASADGSKVFFTSAVALTDDAEPNNTNLYRFDVDTRRLTNLSVDTNPANPGVAVVQGVMAISEDGSRVFFRDTTQYLPGQGNAGDQNLYLWQDGTLRLVGTDTDGGTLLTANGITARATPDARRLIFTSADRLTSYDNTDAATGLPDTEVYLYDADADRLTCVSCRADGRRPTGSASLPAPPPRALRNLQRTITEDGRRVFFDTTDALDPRDVNGKADVYAWEDGEAHLITSGTSTDDSYFGTASADGDDVFFVTRAPLVAADEDDNLDIYDARAGGGYAAPPASTPCSGDGCQGPSTPGPSSPTISSPFVAGDADVAPAARRPATFRVTTPSKSARRTAARTGTLSLAVRVSEGGIVRARATRTVGRHVSTVGTKTAYAPRASTVHVRVRLSKGTRRALKRHTKVRLSLRVSFSHVKTAKTMKLELAR